MLKFTLKFLKPRVMDGRKHLWRIVKKNASIMNCQAAVVRENLQVVVNLYFGMTIQIGNQDGAT